MTKSFFLVHLIDKYKYFGIYSLYGIPDNLFRIGVSQYDGDIPYIKNIEPEPERMDLYSIPTFDTSSIWLGVEIIPKKTFEGNVELYRNLCRWIMDFLYLSRFLINLNLKARIFFHVENYDKENKDNNLSFQRSIELNCNKGSNYNLKYNKYKLLLPLLKKLLQFNPTENLRAIMYNYATSATTNSLVIDYFFNFATLEGVIHNWAETNGYSQLWGLAVADSNEQDKIHEALRTLFTQFVKRQNLEGDKLNQLRSFIDSTFPFPSNRKIMRSIKQRFKSYYNFRLNEELQEIGVIKNLLKNFRRIISRRNEIGHSLEAYIRSPGLIEDINTLMSGIKIIMDYELKMFLDGELDWKFENRINNLRENVRQMAKDNLLNKFTYKITAHNQNNIKLKDRFGKTQIERIEFLSEMKKQSDDETSNLVFSQNLKLILPQDFITRTRNNNDSKIVNAYADPYWWIAVTQDNSHYIFKIFPAKKITSSFDGSVRKVSCEIFSEDILSVVKLDYLAIPEDLDIFAME